MDKTGEVKAGKTPVDAGSEVCDAVVGGKAVKTGAHLVKKAGAEKVDFANGNLKDLCDVH